MASAVVEFHGSPDAASMIAAPGEGGAGVAGAIAVSREGAALARASWCAARGRPP
ncbi:MAG TPA: hypothetical protein VH620_09230 [Gaiella sp.]